MKWLVLALAGVMVGCAGASPGDGSQDDWPEERACLEKHWIMTQVDGNWTCLPRASTPEECVARGGEAIVIDGAFWGCHELTSDAGKPCDGSEDCFGYCEPPEGAAEGDRVTGACSRRTGEECFRKVEDGIVRTWICV